MSWLFDLLQLLEKSMLSEVLTRWKSEIARTHKMINVSLQGKRYVQAPSFFSQILHQHTAKVSLLLSLSDEKTVPTSYLPLTDFYVR